MRHFCQCLFVVILAALAFAQPPTTNLVGRYVAGTGVTSADGRISAWADQSGNGNDLAQTDPNLYPYDTVDGSSRAVVGFRGAESIVIPSEVTLATKSVSIYVVHRAVSTASFALVCGPANLNWFYRYTAETSSPARPTLRSISATAIVPSLLPVIDGALCGSSGNVLFVRNSVSETVAGQGTYSFAGGEVGRLPYNDTAYYFGDIYEILIYSAEQDETDRNATVAYLTSTYSIVSPTTQVTFEGDSITSGWVANTLPWPTQWAPGQTAYAASNRAVAGSDTTSLTARGAVTDGYMAASGTNVLFCMVGINDLDTLSAEDFITAITTYLEARVAAGFDEIWLGTITDTGNSTIDDRAATANASIRTLSSTVPEITKVIDFAANEHFGPGSYAYETANGYVYYQGGAGGFHPSNTGAALLAEIFADEIAATPAAATTSRLGGPRGNGRYSTGIYDRGY